MEARVLAVPAVLLATALAGCLGTGAPVAPSGVEGVLDRLSQVAFDELIKEPLETLAPDGKRLDTFVYRPAAPDGVRVPTLIYFSPYYSNGQGSSRTDNQDTYLQHFHGQVIDYFVPRGYAVVHSAVRGTGYSEGCFTIGGPTESKDHLAVIEHIVQQPWSDGGVAVLGKSYVGTTANDALVEGHPAIKTIVPISAAKSWYEYNFVNGVPIMPQGYAFNLYYAGGVGWMPPMEGGMPNEATAPLLLEEATCPDNADVQLGGAYSAATGDKHAYWQARDYTLEAGKAIAPVFLVHGLQDWNVKPDHILPWASLLAERVPVKMWLGQWAHDYPHKNNFREEWTRGDWNLTLHRWFDHWLKGIDTGILQEPMVDVQDDLGTWRHESAWPPQRARELVLHLGAGTLQAEPGQGAVSWLDNGEPAGKPPEPAAAHYALFVGEPFAQDTRIAGQGAVRLQLGHSAPSGTVAATLWRVNLNGTWERINFGFYDLEHRHGLEASEPVAPGETFALEVPLFPQDDLLPAGSRLALTLAGNDLPGACGGGPFGALGRLPLVGGGECPQEPGPFMAPVPSFGTTTLTLGEGVALVLPVVEGPVAAFAPPPEQPEQAA